MGVCEVPVAVPVVHCFSCLGLMGEALYTAQGDLDSLGTPPPHAVGMRCCTLQRNEASFEILVPGPFAVNAHPKPLSPSGEVCVYASFYAGCCVYPTHSAESCHPKGASVRLTNALQAQRRNPVGGTLLRARTEASLCHGART
uniref:Uncharacterized protein n=1 Tax=Eutreptiella gymnastica TaxID=73025 RepID=A0A7S1IT69_9EUGL|mmetsp:Transcript_41419/g.74292  ORF Transcript_41419/g.74292 Transcript_41419/m.74292 type:complete len:143 (+) Transcript_41419:187-615(+)